VRQGASKTITPLCGVVTMRFKAGVEATPRSIFSYCVVIVTLASQAANTTQTKEGRMQDAGNYRVRRPQATATDEPRRARAAVGWVGR
jgi:hypothetical protein